MNICNALWDLYLILLNLPKLKEEDIVDEMLGILSDRDRIRQKKEMEYNQAKLNEFYMNKDI